MTNVTLPFHNHERNVDVTNPLEVFPLVIGVLILAFMFQVVEAIRSAPIEWAGRGVRALWWLLEHGDDAVDVLQGVVS